MGCAVAVANLHGVGEPLGDRELCVEVRALRQVGVGQLRHLLAVHLDCLVSEVDVQAGVQPREVLRGSPTCTSDQPVTSTMRTVEGVTCSTRFSAPMSP